MELWKESLQTALEERLDAAFAELADFSTTAHPKYDDELKQIVDSYFEAMQLLLGEYSRHLYVQGAKDCVAVLRELGVIK